MKPLGPDFGLWWLDALEVKEFPGATTSAGDYTERFNGKELDEASGLSYYGYRYFDPLSLSWNRGDPLYRFAPNLRPLEPRRANLYGFSIQNPVQYVDLDGLEAVKGGKVEQNLNAQIKVVADGLRTNAPGAREASAMLIGNIAIASDTGGSLELNTTFDKLQTIDTDGNIVDAYAITYSFEDNPTLSSTRVNPETLLLDWDSYEPVAGTLKHEKDHRDTKGNLSFEVRTTVRCRECNTGDPETSSLKKAVHRSLQSEVSAYQAMLDWYAERGASPTAEHVEAAREALEEYAEALKNLE